MLDLLHHLFIPRESNNHRAKFLHIQPLFFLVLLLFLMTVLTPRIEHSYPSVLGITANISTDELVNLTNQQRTQAGLPPLTLDNQLSDAARRKAADMFEKNYWAHTAPDGTTPWVFIKSAGYEYLYAGENLARGFTTASDAMNAWMASPGHKSNILSPNYKNVGFAVATGTLTGDETVLIVEEFGDRLNASSSVNSEQTQTQITSISPTQVPFTSPTPQPTIIAVANIITPTILPTVLPIASLQEENKVATQPVKSGQSLFLASVDRNPLVNKNAWSRNFAILLISFFIFVFVLDMIVVERKNIVRFVSHNADHILFLTLLLLIVLFFGKALIL